MQRSEEEQREFKSKPSIKTKKPIAKTSTKKPKNKDDTTKDEQTTLPLKTDGEESE
jgi:hypothetical protein